MAHFFRLVVVLLCCVLAPLSYAVLPNEEGWAYSAGSGSPVYATVGQACSAFAAFQAQVNPAIGSNSVVGTIRGSKTCDVSRPDPFFLFLSQDMVYVSGSCPAHSIPVSGGCGCDTGYVESGGACVPKPKECIAGTVYSQATSRSIPAGPAPPLPAAVQAVMNQVGIPPRCSSDGCALVPNTDNALNAAAGGVPVGAYRNGVWTINVPQLDYSGANCTASDSDLAAGNGWQTAISTGSPAPTPCPAPKVPGTVNGTNVCVNAEQVATSSSSGSSSGGTTTTTGGASGGSGSGGSGGSGPGGNGSGSGATVIGQGGPSNSSNTTITTCSSTTCTTTATSTSSASAGTGTAAGGSSGGGSGTGTGTGTGTGGGGTGGGTGGAGTKECAAAAAGSTAAAPGGATCTNTTTTTQPLSDYCKENPKAIQCTASQSSFSGNCASGFTSKSDDAVINAMAEETFRQNCKVNPDEASQKLGRDEAAKTGNQTTDNPNNSSVTVSSASFDSSDVIGAGAYCIGDKSVTILHWSATLPFSKVCSSLDILGLALLAVSSLLATRIVARG